MANGGDAKVRNPPLSSAWSAAFFGACLLAASAQGSTLSPKGLIITRTPSGGISSVRTIGGYAPGASTTPFNWQAPGGGNRNLNAPGQNFFLRNSVNSRNVRNAKQATQATQATQPICNGKGLCWSDLRLKRNAELIAHLGNGLNLYRYSYLWSSRLYVGVMAQEVQRVMPDAVVSGPDGFLRVDYAKVGMPFMTWRQWTHASGAPPTEPSL
jgi:hypothetical protein